mgnify:FL=1
MMTICEGVFSIIVIFIIDLVYVHYVVVLRG